MDTIPTKIMNSKVDWYFNKATKWQEKQKMVRTIMLDRGLREALRHGRKVKAHIHGPIPGHSVLLASIWTRPERT